MYLIPELAAALTEANPESALEKVLCLLAGLVLPAEAGQEPWLTLSHAGRTLTLQRVRPDVESGPWADLLRAAFMRAAEHAEDQRVRERLELLSSASFEGLVIHDGGHVIEVNQRLVEMGGYERSELLGPQSLERIVAPEDLHSVIERVRERYEGEYVIGVRRKDGSGFRAEVQAKEGRLGTRPVRVVAVRDVTERERAQSLLRESELRLKQLAEAAFDIISFSRDGIVVDTSGKLEEVVGLKREQIIGLPVSSFAAPSTTDAIEEALSTNRQGTYESVIQTARGEEIPVEILGLQVTLHGEPVRMSAVRDLRAAKRQERERLELEQALARSQRLESLGVLAGGIAHDFNNLLTVVLGQADLLQNMVSAGTARQLVNGIIEAAQRAASLTAQMLAYAGRRELGPRTPVDLSELVKELRALLDAALSKRGHIELTLSDDCVVLGNRATLTQVVMNLLTNASDALGGESGNIRVRTTRLLEVDAHWKVALGENYQTDQTWILLQVEDSGCGMDEATQARVFEPFFSTKPKGHGLGLAACSGIVKTHGGAVRVASQLGHGSTFSVLLPASDELPAARTPQPATPAHQGTRQVLVVDDEPQVRALLRAALTAHDYQVDEAENGLSALEALARSTPSVVLLDMTMPDLSGVEVLRRLRASGSTVPVVLSSGYHDAVLDVDPASFQGFLIKPYTVEELLQTMTRALGT